MHEENLILHVRSYLKTTLSNHHFGRYPNLIKDIQIVRPNQVWCGDITYIKLKKEYAYLGVFNAFRQRCSGRPPCLPDSGVYTEERPYHA